MTSSLPPYLRSRADAAKARASAAAASATSPQTSATAARHTTSPPAHSRVPAPRTARPQPQDTAPAQTAAPPATPKAARGQEEGGNPSAPVVADLTGGAGLEVVADRIVAESRDREGAQALRPVLPAVLAALVRGASIPGSQGAADRSMLLRLIGHASSTAGATEKAGKTIHIHLGGRLGEALARREQAAARVIEGAAEEVGHAAVTAAAAIARKVASD